MSSDLRVLAVGQDTRAAPLRINTILELLARLRP
jgi:hypothetical protein